MPPTNYSKLTKKDKNHILEVSQRNIPAQDKWTLLQKQYGNPTSRTIRNWISKINEERGVETEVTIRNLNRIWEPTGKDTVIVTWAQNSTPVHSGFWNNIKKYAAFRDAEIAIIQGRYSNPTSVWSMKDKRQEWWVDDIEPYLMGNRLGLFDSVQILGDIKIVPTNSNPLRRMYEVSGPRSAILGHPRVHMKTVPVPFDMDPKVVWTTGALTIRNYTDSGNGKVGEFHHTYGFLIIENDGEQVHVRQVTADDVTGDFTDLYWKVTKKGIEEVKEVDALIVSDLHAAFAENENLAATARMLEDLRPRITVTHDIIDAFAVSHHHEKDPFLKIQKRIQGTDDLAFEIAHTFDVLRGYGFTKYNLHVIQSNHDRHIDKWLDSADWRKDPQNGPLFFELGAMKSKMATNGEDLTKGILAKLIERELPNATAVHPNESLMVHGFELSMHGDLGSNGSRGSLNQYSKLPVKTVTGHSHAPGRHGGALSVGAIPFMSDLGYMLGPNNKACANVIIHSDGKAQHLFVVNGSYSKRDAERERSI